MAQPLSIEDTSWTYLITTRTAGSKLWLVNNPELEKLILGILARYQEIYGVIIYAFVLMGNHYHLLARFPNRNRAPFMRDFNSAVARVIGRYVKAHGRRSVWARRYSYQIVPRNEDILHWFFYIALNPVSSGITRSIREYPSYNSFFDAARGHARKYSWIDWSAYLMKSRYNSSLAPSDFSREYTLRFTRLPGFSDLCDQDYFNKLHTILSERESTIVAQRESQGAGFLGVLKLRSQAAGSTPRTTKTSSRYSFRPLVLSLCPIARRRILDIYFAILERFRQASTAFRSGHLKTVFPSGTYRPPLLVPA